jgi:hypothetical protein
MTEAQLRQADIAGANAGLILGTPWVAIDVDGMDIAVHTKDGTETTIGALISSSVIKAFVASAGPQIVRTTVDHRAMILARIPAGADPGGKVVFKLFRTAVNRARTKDDLVCKLEILTLGQQVVIGNRHVSGNPIRWYNTSDPTKTYTAPPVDQAYEFAYYGTLVDFVEAIVMDLPGIEVEVSRSSASAERREGFEHLGAPSADALLNLLEMLPNPAEVDRDEWLSVGFSIAASCHGIPDISDEDREAVRNAFVEWTLRYEGHVERQDDIGLKWDTDISVRDEYTLGWAFLMRFGERHGLSGMRPDDVAAVDAFDAEPLPEPAHGDDELMELMSAPSPAEEMAKQARRQDRAKRETLPVIEIEKGRLDRAATDAESALLASPLPIFQRGVHLVRPFKKTVPSAKGGTTLEAGLLELDGPMLLDRFCQTALWKKFDGRVGGLVNADPPIQIAQVLLRRVGDWSFPHIAGVITCPTRRPNGTILSAPGYDPTTRLFHLVDETLVLSPDLENPTREKALDALNLLNDLIYEFPFVVAENDSGEELHIARSVALSGMLTTVVRGALSVVPLHAFRAPTIGSGKSYLVDVISTIATGGKSSPISVDKEITETEKRIAGSLLEGRLIINIDNVNGELGGDLLCQAVERPVIDIRPLGTSNMVKIESKSCIFATGNQLRVVGDMVRRTLLAELDPRMERAYLRKFQDAPYERVLADRGAYVSPCLMVVRAYLAAGKPNKLDTVGSFEDWSDLVRSALVWLGCADPYLSADNALSNDPETDELREMLSLFSEALGCDNPGFTVREIVDAAQSSLESADVMSVGLAHPEFREALHKLAGAPRGEINTKKLGKWFQSRESRVAGGMRFVRRANAGGGIARWGIERIDADNPQQPIQKAA